MNCKHNPEKGRDPQGLFFCEVAGCEVEPVMRTAKVRRFDQCPHRQAAAKKRKTLRAEVAIALSYIIRSWQRHGIQYTNSDIQASEQRVKACYQIFGKY